MDDTTNTSQAVAFATQHDESPAATGEGSDVPEVVQRLPRAFRQTDPMPVLVYHNLDRQFDALRREIARASKGPVSVECVHRMRTLCRRTRATIRSFREMLPAARTQALAADLSWLAGELGRVRDLDVQREGIVRRGDGNGYSSTPDLAPYLERLAAEHASASQSLARALQSERVRRLLADFEALLNQEPTAETLRRWSGLSVSDGALDYAERARKRVCKLGRRVERGASPARLHKLRIRCKRLRYLLEALEPAFGDRLQGAVKAVRQLQDTLGEIQDVRVSIERVSHQLDTPDAEILSDQERRALLALRARQKLREHAARKDYRKAWRRFEKRVSARRLRHMLD